MFVLFRVIFRTLQFCFAVKSRITALSPNYFIAVFSDVVKCKPYPYCRLSVPSQFIASYQCLFVTEIIFIFLFYKSAVFLCVQMFH